MLIDDASRISYVEVLTDERKTTVIGFVGRALRYFKELGVEVKQFMTDNGSATGRPLPWGRADPSSADPALPSADQWQS